LVSLTQTAGDGNWTAQTQTGVQFFDGIIGVDATHIYAFGVGGIIFSPGDTSWTSQLQAKEIRALFPASPGELLAGGVIDGDLAGAVPQLFASGGTGTWGPSLQTPATDQFVWLWASSGNDVYLSTENGIYHAEATFVLQPGSPTGAAIWGSGPDDIYAATPQQIFHSTGHGDWNAQGGLVGGGGLFAVGGSGRNDIYVVGSTIDGDGGEHGLVLHSIGDGVWTPETLPATARELFAVWANDFSDAYAVGFAGGGAVGIILHKKVQ
jgi:hypothetical protein